MKVPSINIKRDDLFAAVARVVGVVERRSAIVGASQIKFCCSDGALVLSATDTDILVSEHIELSSELGRLVFTVDAYVLQDILRKFDSGADICISFDPSNMRIGISAGQCNFVLPGRSADEFPFIDTSGLEERLSVSSDSIIKLFDRTKFAISTEGRRHNLSGCYLEFKKDMVRGVATDGHRLALHGCDGVFCIKENDNIGFILPRKTVIELLRLIKTKELEVFLPKGIKVNKVSFCFGNTKVFSKVIDAEFPDYDRVVPKDHNFIVKLDRELLISAVGRVSVIFADKAKPVRLKFIEDGSLELRTASADSSSAREVVPIIEGAVDFEVGFNHSYLLDVLLSIDSKEVSFYLVDEKSAVVIADEMQRNRCFCIIMPMSI